MFLDPITRQTRKRVAGFGGFLTFVGAVAALAAFRGWLVMLLAGIAYHEMGIGRPIGFKISVVAGILWAMLMPSSRSDG